MKGWLQGFNEESEAGGTPAPRIMANWGFQPKSSGGKLCLSALLKYGLITQEGTSNGGLFRLSGAVFAQSKRRRGAETRETAKGRASPGDSRRTLESLVRKSAGRQSDSALHPAADFNSSAVSGVIAVLRESLEFAGLAGEGRMHAGDRPEASTVPTRTGAALANVHLEMRRDTFRLKEGEDVLQWPQRMTKAGFKDFEGWLQFIIQKASRSVIRESERPSHEASDQ